MKTESKNEAGSRRGRAFGVVSFGLIVGGLTAVLAGQILVATFAPDAPALTAPCDRSLARLWTALERARQSAAEVSGAEQSIEAFRAGLEPEWQERASVERHCGSQVKWAEASRQLVALRFAEERAVRLLGADLNGARARVAELVRAGSPRDVASPSP